ncbi:MAG: anthranilate phosphoribosyltransferase [Gammaproteobacteria bacterium]|nr:anthranilate phosphoribosyltransferase [Gammaproteobacteria bacterium]
MDMQQALRTVVDRHDLSRVDMENVMRIIMRGEATPAQIGGFLVALRMKGESVIEVTAAASVMREFATRVPIAGEHLVDTAGTGGDGTNTFNISTTAAFVAAAAGARVAKHGNRSLSSKSGSADVLEAAGVNITLSAEAVASCIDEVGIGFMFAPSHHGATRHAAGPRRELGIRTLFNALGPLTNPAGAPNQVVGIFSREWVLPACEALKALGSNHVLVFHAEDGMDEISIGAPTHVAELNNGSISTYELRPEQFGFLRQSVEALRVDSVEASLKLMRSVLSNQAGPGRDIVCLNAGAAIYAAGRAATLAEGVHAADKALTSGDALRKLQQLVAVSNSLAGSAG